MNIEKLKEFVEYVNQLKGDEKGEAQLFCDRLFRAFGHGGIIEANGALEARIKFNSGRTKFADCLWSPPGKDGVLIEMKKSLIGNLENHFSQVRDYWIEMNPEVVIGPGAQKPKYIILCNFKKFRIYKQLSFVDEINIDEIIDRSNAFNFLLSEPKEPIFNCNVEAISKDASAIVGELFKYLIFEKNKNRETVQRFVLQCVLSMFSEDFGLLPDFIFTELVKECMKGQSAYDLLGGLFQQMANPVRAKGGKFIKVPYFNGGLFDLVEPVELDEYCLELLNKSAEFNWKYVNPSIFGSLFESTMNAEERHAFGAHFTSEEDILKIINPTIVRPWKEQIAKTHTLTELNSLLEQLSTFIVLDPACGCGNFLFLAYKELKEIEMQIIEKISKNFTVRSISSLKLGVSNITTKQFRGIDVQPIAVEVAKMTMMLAKELSAEDWNNRITPIYSSLNMSFDEGLPLERLDDYIECKDALTEEWPKFDAIIGNPPYQSKNKMKQEMDSTYIEAIRELYPEVPGRADYCVYWFFKAHKLMEKGQRAGLVGTNTIRQNYSREGGLDYIVNNKGTITDAVSTQVWSGDAVVYVSIVNWIKDDYDKEKTLIFQKGDALDSPFEYYHPEIINSALSLSIDVSSAKSLKTNVESEICYQGQTHGHKGFLLDKSEAEKLLINNPKNKDVLFPYLTGDEMLGNIDSLPKRYVIDFGESDVFEASKYKDVFGIIEKLVFSDKERKALNEEVKNNEILSKNPNARLNKHHSHAFKTWWQLIWKRTELMQKIDSISRYCVCARVTKRPIFEFVSSAIHPNDALQIFPFEDDYSFGILQSQIHWEWFKARCSTLKGDWRYTSNTVFDSFPWPQNPDVKNIEKIAKLSQELRLLRREVMSDKKCSLRDLYRLMEKTPNNPIGDKQGALDNAVREAYGMNKKDDILFFLLNLNAELSLLEEKGEIIQGPGLPDSVSNFDKLLTEDCVNIDR